MKRYIALYIFFALIFLGHYAVAKQAVYGDGIDYWAYLHTWYFDHDLNFTNEFKHQYGPVYNNQYMIAEASVPQKTSLTRLGKVDDVHTPGTAIVFLPFYVLADWLAVFFRAIGVQMMRNGYSDIYQLVVGLGAVGYMVIGIFLVEKLCRLFVKDRAVCFPAAVGVVLCSPLLYYGSYDIINSHFASFFITALFWLLLFTRDFSRKKNLIVIGAVFALTVMIRLQDALLVIPLLATYIAQDKAQWKQRTMLTLGVGALCFTMLLAQWQLLYGIPFPVSYFLSKQRYFDGMFGSWFNPMNGILTKTPFLLVSLVGVVHVLVQKKEIQHIVLFGVYLLLTTIVITWQGGWHDAAYGGRMYISVLPIFAVFATYLFESVHRRFSLWACYLIVGLFFIANAFNAANFVLFEKQVNSGKKTGLEESTQIQIQHILQRIKITR